MNLKLRLVFVFFFHWETRAGDMKCNLSKKTLTFTYSCIFGPQQNVSVIFEPSVIEMSCFKIESSNDIALLDINFGRQIDELRVYGCPIPNKGFQEILKILHIEKLGSFTFYRSSSNESFRMRHFQQFQSLRELRLGKNHIKHFDGNIFSYMPNLTILDLNGNSLILYDSQFKNAPLLISLYLINSNITNLPPKVFIGLKQLKELYLSSNKIETIENNVFRDLINLETLHLDKNSLRKLDLNVFEYLGKLSYLDLDNNKLNYISERLFTNSTSLETIRLNDNNNLVLEDMIFPEQLYLNLVTLKNCAISNLPENPFLGSVNLHHIDLQYNNVKYLPKDIFKNLEYLGKLYLNNNRIETIHIDNFASLINLQILNLQHNLLSAVNRGVLKNLHNLEQLDLSFNQIHTIDSDIFFEKSNLVHFRINNNNLELIDFFPLNLRDCKSIKVLDFTSNNISLFPSEILAMLIETISNYNINMSIYSHKQHKKLEKNNQNNSKTIIMDGSMLLRTSEQQGQNSVKIILLLKNNNISQIKFNNSLANSLTNTQESLIQVDISQNPINCDCQALDLVTRSQRIGDPEDGITYNYDNLFCNAPPNLANTSIRKVDANQLICSLKKKCTKNQECDCYYKSMTETIIIDCSKRNLSEIPQLVFGGLHEDFEFVKLNKVELHLEDNLLEEGPADQAQYHNITGLYLQRNKLKYMVWLPPHLEVLNLESNHLEYLDPKILSLLNQTNIRELRFSSNPWGCDCKSKDFISYLWTHILQIKNATNIRCRGIGMALIDLEEEDFCPITTVFTSVVSSGILICFIIFSATILLFYIYEKEILIWLYARDSCLWLIKEERIDKNKKYDAFVSFAHQDEEFVMDRLVAILELGSPQYKFCVHIRDWIPGEYIATQIANSVRDSRRTLIVLSPNFITSIWGRMEFRTAHTSAMKEGRVRIILIVYGDIEMDQLDDELKAYIRTNTYIKWGDPWFWEKLKYALPRTRHRDKKPRVRMRQNSTQNDIELQETNS